MTLRVALVVPDRQLWSGQASIVIAKTLEGDIGVLTGHSPVFGVLAGGSVVEIVPEEAGEQPRVKAAISGGFLSVANDHVSILAADALLANIAADLDHASDRHFDDFHRNLHIIAAMRAVQQVLA